MHGEPNACKVAAVEARVGLSRCAAHNSGNTAGLPAFWRQAARQQGPAFRGWQAHVCGQHADGVAADPLLAMISGVLRSGGASVSRRSFADLPALSCGLRGRNTAESNKTVIVFRDDAEIGRCAHARPARVQMTRVPALQVSVTIARDAG